MNWLQRAVLFAVSISACSILADDNELPIPSDSSLREALALVNEIYGEEIVSATTHEQALELVELLVDRARETDAPVNRYALLDKALAIATESGHGLAAYNTIDEMARHYAVDALALKISLLQSFSKKSASSAQYRSIIEQSLAMIGQAIREDDYEGAAELTEIALTESRKTRDQGLLRSVIARKKEVDGLAKEYESIKSAVRTLAIKPADRDANLAVGKYRCFVQGEWDRGLPMLARGNDETLAALATKELEGASAHVEQAKLADAWWEASDTQDEAIKARLRERAAYWYAKALPGLSGLQRDKAKMRIGDDVIEDEDVSDWILGTFVVRYGNGGSGWERRFLPDGTFTTKDKKSGKHVYYGTWRIDRDNNVVRLKFNKTGGTSVMKFRNKNEYDAIRTLRSGQKYGTGQRVE